MTQTIPGQLGSRGVDHILNFHADFPGLSRVIEVSHLPLTQFYLTYINRPEFKKSEAKF